MSYGALGQRPKPCANQIQRRHKHIYMQRTFKHGNIRFFVFPDMHLHRGSGLPHAISGGYRQSGNGGNYPPKEMPG